MSNNYNWDDEDEDLDAEYGAPTGDNDLLKKLRKAKRADEKHIKELTDKYESLLKVERERTVKEVLEKNGVNPKASRYILNDITEINEDAVSNWLRDNGELFGYKPEATGAPAVSEEHRQALRAQDTFTQGAKTPDIAEDLEQLILNADSNEELDKLLGNK